MGLVPKALPKTETPAIDESIVVKYAGGIADQHRLPALEAGISIQGIARSITLVTTFLANGKIRKHAPFDSAIRIYIRPLQTGSVDTLYQIVSNIDPIIMAADLIVGVTGSLIYDTIKTVFNRVTGRDSEPETDGLKLLEDKRGGDISALEDAVEPALVQAHRVIGNGSNNIIIIGNGNRITFDAETRDFISATRADEAREIKQVSVGSYNVNSKSGRVFDFEFKKTIPFTINSSASQRTAVAIARNLTEYAGAERSKVEIVYSKILAPDGRIKRYIIYGATKPKREQ